MRISDWSSDVCSSDLSEVLHDREATLLDKGVDQFPDDHHHVIFHLTHATGGKSAVDQLAITRVRWRIVADQGIGKIPKAFFVVNQIGRASCGESLCQYL